MSKSLKRERATKKYEACSPGISPLPGIAKEHPQLYLLKSEYFAMSYCLHCHANQPTDAVERKIEQQTFVSTGPNGQGYYQNSSYWVTDYYCQGCKRHIAFPRATNPKEYNEARSLSVSLWLWVPVYVSLAIALHNRFSSQIIQNTSGWTSIATYGVIILLIPWGCCWVLHKLLPKFFYENIAFLIRAIFITALEGLLLLIPIVIIGIALKWTYEELKAIALMLGSIFLLFRCPRRIREIIEENRLRHELNQRSR